MMFSTNISRSANDILAEQSAETDKGVNFDRLHKIKDHCEAVTQIFRNEIDIFELGRILDETWQVKRTLSSGISNSDIDVWYERAKSSGALGGKLCGAGGGGYLMFIVPNESKNSVRAALADLIEAPFKFEPLGTQSIVAR